MPGDPRPSCRVGRATPRAGWRTRDQVGAIDRGPNQVCGLLLRPMPVDQFCAVRPVWSWSSRDTDGCWLPTALCSPFPLFTISTRRRVHPPGRESGLDRRIREQPPRRRLSRATSRRVEDSPVIRLRAGAGLSQIGDRGVLRNGRDTCFGLGSHHHIGLASMDHHWRGGGRHRADHAIRRAVTPPICLCESLCGLTGLPTAQG